MKSKETTYRKACLCLGFCSILLGLLVLLLLIRGNYFASLKSSMNKANYDYTSNACYTQRASQFEMLPQKHVQVVFAGDSITQRFEWQEYFSGLSVANRGIDSDVSLGLLNRMDTITDLTPDKLFLMIGINDIRQQIPTASTIQNMQSILDIAKKEVPNCQIYIQSVIPVSIKTGITSDQIRSLNEALRELADTNDVNYIDVFTPLLSSQDDFSFTVDGVHPTGEGYQIWMDTIAPYVAE